MSGNQAIKLKNSPMKSLLRLLIGEETWGYYIANIEKARTRQVRAGKNILLFSGQSFESKSVKHLIGIDRLNKRQHSSI